MNVSLSVVFCGFALSSLALPAQAETVVRTFDGASNPDGWNWGFGNSFPAAGGNPGAYLRTDGLDTFAPQPRTTVANSPFLGNLRAAGVVSIGVDLAAFSNNTTGGRPLTLMLMHNNGTPSNPSDDTAAYFKGPNIPSLGQGWVSYDFNVPTEQTSLPAGWELLNMGDSGSPAIHTWNQVVENVSQVRFFYGDPTMFFIFQTWSLGMDNLRITMKPLKQPCPPDVGGDGVVDVLDLLAVINSWGAGAGSPADIDGNGTVDVNDLLAVINGWGACP